VGRRPARRCERGRPSNDRAGREHGENRSKTVRRCVHQRAAGKSAAVFRNNEPSHEQRQHAAEQRIRDGEQRGHEERRAQRTIKSRDRKGGVLEEDLYVVGRHAG